MAQSPIYRCKPLTRRLDMLCYRMYTRRVAVGVSTFITSENEIKSNTVYIFEQNPWTQSLTITSILPVSLLIFPLSQSPIPAIVQNFSKVLCCDSFLFLQL